MTTDAKRRTMRERFEDMIALRDNLGITEDEACEIRLLSGQLDDLTLFGSVSPETRAFAAILGEPHVNLDGWAEWRNATSRVLFTGWSHK